MMHFLGFTLSPSECIWLGVALGWLACGASVLIVPTIWRIRDIRSLIDSELDNLIQECVDEYQARHHKNPFEMIDND